MKKTLIISALFIALSACQKEGPIGPAGNANVKTSVHGVDRFAWQNAGGLLYLNIESANITQAINNTGTVDVYLSDVSSSGPWVSMPYQKIETGFFTNYVFYSTVGMVQIQLSNSNASLPVVSDSLFFKLVAVSGQ